jgi:hypothetical protein
MADTKTKPTDRSVEEFLKEVENPTKKKDSFEILRMMKKVTQEEPVIWGDSIVGFGSYHYKYSSGREGDSPMVGFSPRKQNLTIYIQDGIDKYDVLLKKLGKFKTGKVCLYINKLNDVDNEILKQILTKSVEYMKKEYS